VWEKKHRRYRVEQRTKNKGKREEKRESMPNRSGGGLTKNVQDGKEEKTSQLRRRSQENR